MGPKLDNLSPILNIAFDPWQSSALNTIVLQFGAQYFMINGIKCLRSKNMPKVDSFLSIAEDMLLIKSIKASAVKWLLRNPNCF